MRARVWTVDSALHSNYDVILDRWRISIVGPLLHGTPMLLRHCYWAETTAHIVAALQKVKSIIPLMRMASVVRSYN